MIVQADWIAVDWGTTRLRAWAMREDGKVLADASSDRGMSTLTTDAFEAALIDLVADWLVGDCTPVIACGMVGAKQGWVEARYASVPCAPIAEDLTAAPTVNPRLDVQIVPGLSQSTPADVMRGEETQIAGYLAIHPAFDGVLCLPGTHTKWVQISAGEVVSFRTVMTGDLFSAVSGHTVLRHSMTDGTWDEDAFDTAVLDTLSQPELLSSRLFGIRAEGLLQGLSGGAAKARLSGLLIGCELAATRPYWLGQQVALIGADGMSALYARALESQGVIATVEDTADMTLRGLEFARSKRKLSA